MKYFINRTTGALLKDRNNTPYLTDRGYEEISQQEYKIEEQNFIRQHENDD